MGTYVTGDWWELEQAFAEDASGNLGVYVWPPRRYSCSFCKREFKSAQALGGHMNVHRRDRAILKQLPNSTPPYSTPHHNQMMDQCTNFLYNTHNNLSCLEPSDDHSVPPAFSFIRVSSPFPSTPSITSSSFVAREPRKILNDHIVDRDRDSLIKNEEITKRSSVSIFGEKLELSTSLNNLFVCTDQTRENIYSGDEELEVENCCKRRKMINEKQGLINFLPKMMISSNQVERWSCQQSEELDLELRLGVAAPKVK